MNSLPRFYVPPDEWPEGAAELTIGGEEAHHLRNVLRAEPGRAIELFDGRGREAEATVLTVSKRGATAQIDSARTLPPPARGIVLAMALTKGKTMDLIIQKTTELGVTTILPITADRSVVQLKGRPEAERRRDKWQRVALEACKQCGRAWVPEVATPAPLAEVLASEAASSAAARLIAALPEGSKPLRDLLPPNTPSALVCIGPEGDFTDSEYATAQDAGLSPLTLGPTVLRAETAAVHAVGLLAYELGR